MAQKRVSFEGRTYVFPDDFTDEEISQQLAADHDAGSSAPNAGLASPSGGSPPKRLSQLSDEYGSRAQEAETQGDVVDELNRGSSAHPMMSLPYLASKNFGEAGHDITSGHIKRGLHKAVVGSAQAAGPFALPYAAVTAPIPTALAASTGYVGGKVLRTGAKVFGGDEDTQNLAEDVGNIGGAVTAPSAVRGTGRLLDMVSRAPDAPVSDLLPRSVNLASKVFNASKSGAGSVGRKMKNYGVKIPFDATPQPEPDLPRIAPDGQSHYNDVTDQGELNRLLDAVREAPEPKPTADPVGRDFSAHHDDVREKLPDTQGAPDEDLIDMVQRRGAVMPSAQAARTVNNLPTNTADLVPTPNSNTLLQAIRSAPGWPENGQPNKPWPILHAEDELPDALATDPYNRQPESIIQGPTYSGPERRGLPRDEVLPNSPDDPYYFGPDFKSNLPEGGLTIDGRLAPKELPSGLAETTAASDPQGDMNALTQARQELPQGSLSDHLQRAAQIAADNRQTNNNSTHMQQETPSQDNSGLTSSPLPDRFKPIVLGHSASDVPTPSPSGHKSPIPIGKILGVAGTVLGLSDAAGVDRDTKTVDHHPKLSKPSPGHSTNRLTKDIHTGSDLPYQPDFGLTAPRSSFTQLVDPDLGYVPYSLDDKLQEFKNEAAKQGIRLRIGEIDRTEESQNRIYNQGRDPEGNIIGPVATNARGGLSLHQYHKAFDADAVDPNDQDRLGQIARRIGLVWGGDFESINDPRHFELPSKLLPPRTNPKLPIPEGLIQK